MNKTCVICNKDFVTLRKDAEICSVKCRVMKSRRAKNPNQTPSLLEVPSFAIAQEVPVVIPLVEQKPISFTGKEGDCLNCGFIRVQNLYMMERIKELEIRLRSDKGETVIQLD